MPKIIAFDGIENLTVRSSKIPKNSEVVAKKTRIHFFSGSAKNKIVSLLKTEVGDWQLTEWQESQPSLANYQTPQGALIVVWYRADKDPEGSVRFGTYAKFRDLAGTVVRSQKFGAESRVDIDASGLSNEMVRGLLVGVSLAQYRYSDSVAAPQIEIALPKTFKRNDLEESRQLAMGMNMARRLVDMPANELHPTSYAAGIKKHFQGLAHTKVQVLGRDQLVKQKMGLHLAVGDAAEFPPCLVHIQYRPKSRLQPIAFVGKGITFDSGGLDIKPTNAMRLMKKDMGGSASVSGLAHYMIHTGVKQPADFYLALAENAISSNAFRPGDVVTSRSGKTVEIHNTDAEGRLVMADAMDYAVTAKGANKPSQLIDVATLTGAVKVGLGSEVAGLLSNNDKLARAIQKCSELMGDPVWQLPLYRGYRAKFRSAFADMTNAVDGFGGAINAALFLENFVGEVPWAHLDIYAWSDRANGCFADLGGTGQGVQTLAEYVRSLTSKK